MGVFDVHVDPAGVLCLAGEFDMNATDAFAEVAAHHVIESEGDVIVDLSRLDFIDSSGIRALLALETRDRRLILRRPSPRVKKVLELTGIIGRRGITMTDE
jgi:anti-anti-sigma factor